MRRFWFALAGLAALSASPALALDVKSTLEVTGTPDKVWAAVGDFCGIGQWHPAVVKCEPSEEGGKTIRTLTLKGGGTIKEELVSRDDDKMTYTYRIVESPLPVDNYESTLAVTAASDGDADEADLVWTGTFEAKGASDDEAKKVIGGIYDAGLKGIAEKAGK